MGVCPHGNTERPCKTKVGELQIVVLVNQEVLRLEIAVKNTVRMTVKQAGVELMGKFLQGVQSVSACEESINH